MYSLLLPRLFTLYYYIIAYNIDTAGVALFAADILYGDRVDRVVVRFYFGAGHCFGSPEIMKSGLRNDNIFYIMTTWQNIILYDRYRLAAVL